MFYKCLSDFVPTREKQAEDTLGHIAFASSLGDSNADQFGSTGMSSVSIDYYRASGRERRGRVTAGYRICKWKIAGAKNGDRSKRSKHCPQVRFWHRLTVGNRVVDARVDPRTFVQKVGKHPELHARSCPFAMKARCRQRSLQRRTFEKCVAESLDIVGDRA